MATFKELASPIVKANKKEELLEIVNDANRIIEGFGTEQMMTGNGTATVGIAYCFKGVRLPCVLRQRCRCFLSRR